MLNTGKDFIVELLKEVSPDTASGIIKGFDLPRKLRNTLIDYYVTGLGIKEIADKYSVDDRTVKRWLAEAYETAADHLKNSLRINYPSLL